jgi:threonine dehydrogenase-like Zn-dependent dehydrogenase
MKIVALIFLLAYNTGMDKWVLTGPKTLAKQLQTESAVSPTQVKVKVTHILISNYDSLIYSGDLKVTYPKVIGRFAIGIVTDLGSECYGLEKGARVYLEPARACRACLACKSGNTANCESVKIAGRDFDGFMRDFVVCEYNEVCPLPDSVDDLHALCIENVALAENIFDRLNLNAGSKVAIVGGGFFGSILTQVALYHKFIPIVIDNYKQNIERLKRNGVYYAFEADDDLLNNIMDATSGSLCDGAIYTSCCKLSTAIPARVLAKKKDMVLGGFSTVSSLFDTQHMFEKGLRMYAVSDGYDYTEVAINMLVHGAINLDSFEKRILTDFTPETLLQEQLNNLAYNGTMTILKLVL